MKILKVKIGRKPLVCNYIKGGDVHSLLFETLWLRMGYMQSIIFAVKKGVDEQG